MDNNFIEFYLTVNSDKFEPEAMPAIKEKLERMTPDQYAYVQSISLQNPTTIIIIAIFLGWDRLFLDDIGMGVLKIVTCGGLYIWWLVDIFTATRRTKEYNYTKFMNLTAGI